MWTNHTAAFKWSDATTGVVPRLTAAALFVVAGCAVGSVRQARVGGLARYPEAGTIAVATAQPNPAAVPDTSVGGRVAAGALGALATAGLATVDVTGHAGDHLTLRFDVIEAVAPVAPSLGATGLGKSALSSARSWIGLAGAGDAGAAAGRLVIEGRLFTAGQREVGYVRWDTRARPKRSPSEAGEESGAGARAPGGGAPARHRRSPRRRRAPGAHADAAYARGRAKSWSATTSCCSRASAPACRGACSSTSGPAGSHPGRGRDRLRRARHRGRRRGRRRGARFLRPRPEGARARRDRASCPPSPSRTTCSTSSAWARAAPASCCSATARAAADSASSPAPTRSSICSPPSPASTSARCRSPPEPTCSTTTTTCRNPPRSRPVAAAPPPTAPAAHGRRDPLRFRLRAPRPPADPGPALRRLRGRAGPPLGDHGRLADSAISSRAPSPAPACAGCSAGRARAACWRSIACASASTSRWSGCSRAPTTSGSMQHGARALPLPWAGVGFYFEDETRAAGSFHLSRSLSPRRCRRLRSRTPIRLAARRKCRDPVS